jgi:hypothetical protein
MFGKNKPNIFQNMLPEFKLKTLDVEELDAKLERAFLRMKRKAADRERKIKKRNANWNPELGDKLLVKCQNKSDAAKGVIDKFMHVYQGPYSINKILPYSAYEVIDSDGKLRGEFNKMQLKPYRMESDPKNIEVINTEIEELERCGIKQPGEKNRK